jgi:surface polysaccharide O-acyltransferase-like enzyme
MFTKAKKQKNKILTKKKKKLIEENKNIEQIHSNIPIKRTRHYGIDLARIFAMILIINHHIIHHGGPLFSSPRLSKEFNFFLFFNMVSFSGVNIFGMISGFVGFQTHKYSNLLFILIMAFCYNYGIAFFLKNYWLKLNIDNMKHFLYPIFISDYWYVTAYFCMYFLLPIVNKGIIGFEKEEMKYFLIIIFLIFSCFGEIPNHTPKLGSDLFGLRSGFTYTWLFILYLFGSYFGKFKKTVNKYKFLFYLKYLIIILLFPYLRIKLLFNRYKKYNRLNIDVNYTSPESVIIAFGFINIFSVVDFKNKYIVKIISFFSSLTFGIYLIHNHPLVRGNIIGKDFRWLLKYKSYKLIFLEIYCSLKVFMICSIIDYGRYIVFKLLRIREICILIEKLISFVSSKIVLVISMII